MREKCSYQAVLAALKQEIMARSMAMGCRVRQEEMLRKGGEGECRHLTVRFFLLGFK